MKALVFAAAIAALTSSALAGAARDTRTPAVADTATAALVADAGRIGSASLTALNGSHWTPAAPRAEVQSQDAVLRIAGDLDAGALVFGLGVGALLLARPLSRALRRQEQQRRAAALAATLPRR